MRMRNLTQKAAAAVNNAEKFALEKRCKITGSDHLLAGLISEKCVASELLKEQGVTLEKIEEFTSDTSNFFEMDEQPMYPGELDRYTSGFYEVMLEAARLSSLAGLTEIGTEFILLGIIRTHECMAYKTLAGLGVNTKMLYSKIKETVNKPELSKAVKIESNGKNDQKSVLKRFTRDLTLAARSGTLEPVIGRDKEITRIMQILGRKTKNNPCLIGEPGVGKTAVVEGLALRIANGMVPDSMREKRILTVDITAMVAGTKYRGEFEERIKKLISEVINDKDVLLFVDEVHMLIGAGDSVGSMDAANILKPALARGELQIIGATTTEEYRKNIEKDAALERRFQPVAVDEPDTEECEEILAGIRPAYEKHHGVKISDEAVKAAVRLSARYINDRFLPDKAIDLMDEAASKISMSTPQSKAENETVKYNVYEKLKEEAILEGDFEKASEINAFQMSLLENIAANSKKNSRKISRVVGEDDIADVVAAWTGIPLRTLTRTETQMLKNLEKTMHERVIGQDEAISAVAKAVRRGRVGLKDANKPVGSFLFLGPTGVGKTEVSKALAEAVFGSEKSIIRVDMSEYMEKASVSKLIGSPPGYVGYDEGGQLAKQVRRRPYSVVLFDEIEKAHPDIFNILLQILDEGRVTDSQGRHVDFKNTIIIMTSNCGASNITGTRPLGFGQTENSSQKYEVMKNKVMDEVKKTFRPEFLNRIDGITVFHSLEKNELLKITELMLKKVAGNAKKQLGLSIEFSQEVIEFLTEKGYDVKYGARPIGRAILAYVEDCVTDAYLDGRIKKDSTLRMEMNGDKPEVKLINGRN